MPFKRKRRTKRRYKRKGRDTVRKVRRAVRKIQSQVETKNFVVARETFNVSDLPHVIFCQPVINADSGIESHQFIGRKYHTVGIKVNAIIKKITDNTGQVSNLRFIGLWVRGYTPPETTSDTFHEYFEQFDDTTQAIPATLAPLKSSKAKTVRMLWDKKYSFGIKNTAAGGFAAGSQSRFINFYKSINSPTTFNTQDDEFSQGKLYVYLMDQFENQAAITLVTKFYYTDS